MLALIESLQDQGDLIAEVGADARATRSASRSDGAGGAVRAPAVGAASLALALALGLLASCGGDGGPSADGADDRAADGRRARRAQGGRRARSSTRARRRSPSPCPGLTGEQRRTFAVGNSFFNQNWVTAPASTEGRDGLGPLFNAQSCSSCHFKDGRGRPPESTPTTPSGAC